MSLVTPKTNLKLLHVCLNYQQTHNNKYTRTVKLSTKYWVMTVMSNILFTSAVWFICSAPEKKKNAFHLLFTLTYSKWTKRNGEGLIHWTFMQFIILLNHVCCYSTQYCGWPGCFDSVNQVIWTTATEFRWSLGQMWKQPKATVNELKG